MEKDTRAFVIGAGAAALMTAALFGGILIAQTQEYDHDPAKLLQLREACLRNDPSKYTIYCDNYAERYSRVSK